MTEDLSKKLYVSNRDSWEANLSIKRFSDRELEVKVVEHGIILPQRKINGARKGGVCDNDFNFVAGFSRIPNNNVGGFSTIRSSYPVDRKNIVELDEDVIFGGVLIGHL